jgi:hypothetical protein
MASTYYRPCYSGNPSCEGPDRGSTWCDACKSHRAEYDAWEQAQECTDKLAELIVANWCLWNGGDGRGGAIARLLSKSLNKHGWDVDLWTIR